MYTCTTPNQLFVTGREHSEKILTAFLESFVPTVGRSAGPVRPSVRPSVRSPFTPLPFLLFFLFSSPRCCFADGNATATIVLPSQGENTFGALMRTAQDVRDFFGTHYPCAFGPEGPSEEVAKDFLERK